MKIILAVLILGSLVATNAYYNRKRLDTKSELDGHWDQYKTAHNKLYESNEEGLRRRIWEDNLRMIQQHNLEFDMGQHTYSLGMNEFGDMTHEEFKSAYLSYKRPNLRDGSSSTYLPPLNSPQLPDSIDWRTQGYVTPVKDQGQCGSCWAFSTTGSLEGQYFRAHGHLLSFSEQQLVDCSGSYGNEGCNGGLMDSGFDYIKKYGIELESDYPYTARDGRCNYDSSKVQTKISSYVDIRQGNESDLQSAVATVGPVSVAIDAAHNSFQFYRSGVYNEKSCSSTELDHGVLAIGYGVENGVDYWLVKNSWGSSWGDRGIIKMSRNKNNQCGIATASSYPLI